MWLRLRIERAVVETSREGLKTMHMFTDLIWPEVFRLGQNFDQQLRCQYELIFGHKKSHDICCKMAYFSNIALANTSKRCSRWVKISLCEGESSSHWHLIKRTNILTKTKRTSWS
jgi:hypothetical protein